MSDPNAPVGTGLTHIDAEGRARNRRVEMAPVPKSSRVGKEGNG